MSLLRRSSFPRGRAAGRPPVPRLVPLAVALACAGPFGEALAQSTVTLPVLRSGGVLRGVLAPVTAGATMTINQTAARGVIEWSSFSIGQGGTVNVVQPDGSSVLLNRVIGNTSGSVIDGALNANGRVFVVDPSGVVFGANARVNVGGLVASALDLRNGAADYDAFVAGGGLSLVTPATPPALVGTAEGAQITTPVGGQVMLLSPQTLLHDGTITARQGQVTLAAGGSATLGIGSSGFITLDLGRAVPGQGFYTSPQIITGLNSVIDVTGDAAAGGQVRLQASGDTGPESVPRVTLQGRVDASGGGGGGSIEVAAGPEGQVQLSGVLQANGGAAATGGTIKLAAQDITLQGGVTAGAEPLVEAAGGSGGGEIVLAADRFFTLQDGRIDARGTGSGALGGRVGITGFGILLDDQQFSGGAQIDVSGGRGGGSLQIGNDQTRSLTLTRNMLLRADATLAGDGGSVLLSAGFVGSGQEPPGPGSSFGVASLFGAVSARGGEGGGDGGTITLRGAALATELSLLSGSWAGPAQPSTNGLQFDATAANPGGRHGRLSVHTGNLSLDAVAAAENGNGFFSPTGADSVLTTAQLEATLDAGMNVDLLADMVAGAGLRLAPRASLQLGARPGNLSLSGDGVVLGAGSSIDAAGPMSLTVTATGQDLLVEGDVALFTSATATGAVGLRLAARRDLRLSEGTRIGDSARGAPITLTMLADTGGTGEGGIGLDGDTAGGTVGIAIATAGGAITLSGGADPAVDAATRADVAGIRLANARLDAGTGSITLRGRGLPGEGDATTGVSLTDSTLNGGTLAITGASDGGTAVSLVRSTLTATGDVRIHGTATSSSRGDDRGAPVGVAVQDSRVVLGTGNGSGAFTLTGRAERGPGASGTAPGATGLSLDGLAVSTDRVSAGRVTLVGQGVGAGSRGIAAPAVSTLAPFSVSGDDLTTGAADLVIGAQADAGGRALALDGLDPLVRTTGTVNVRPLGVDVHGALVEQGGTAIQVGGPTGTAPRPFIVPAAWLIDGTRDGAGSFRVGALVIGSAAQRAAIEVGRLALPSVPHASITLQNGGAGSQGIVLGGGIPSIDGPLQPLPSTGSGLQATQGLNQLTLITDGPVTQLDALLLDRLVIRGSQGTADVRLDAAGNQIGELAATDLARLVLRNDGPGGLTVTDASAVGWGDTGPEEASPVAGLSARDGVRVDTAGDLTLQAGAVSASGTGARIDLITGGVFRNTGNLTLNTGAGGGWRVWTTTWEGMVTGGLQGSGPTPNLYGCAWGDASVCSVSGVALPAGGSGFVFRQQPTLVVDPSRTTYAQGQPVPPIAFSSTGLVNGDLAAGVLAGALGSSAGAGSAPGTYDVTLGSLVSPAGYRVQLGSSAVGGITLLAGVLGLPAGTTPHGDFSALLSRTSSEVNGRNLSRPLMCLAPGAQRRAAEGEGDDLLGLEWGRVRHQPQLSSCLDLGDDGQCAAF